jgi:hypothetical protein
VDHQSSDVSQDSSDEIRDIQKNQVVLSCVKPPVATVARDGPDLTTGAVMSRRDDEISEISPPRRPFAKPEARRKRGRNFGVGLILIYF